jgi:hypothetical protein
MPHFLNTSKISFHCREAEILSLSKLMLYDALGFSFEKLDILLPTLTSSGVANDTTTTACGRSCSEFLYNKWFTTMDRHNIKFRQKLEPKIYP